MNRSQIEYILKLDQLRNFGKAAGACFVTQSTLSAMVAKFEEQSGVTIFNRKTRPISVTPQGELLLKALKNIYREFQILDEQINELRGYEGSQLSLACIPTVAPYLYPFILDKLSHHYSGVNFIIHELTTEQIIESLLSGEIDLGIVSTPLDNEQLIEHHLYNEDFLLYDCGNSSQTKTYNVADIDLDRLWLLEEGHCLRNQVGKICELRQQNKINGNLTYSCGSIYTLIEMVKINKGVTLLPKMATLKNPNIKSHQLHELKSPVPAREIGLVTHRNFIKNSMRDKIIEIIQAVIKKQVKLNSNTSVVKPY